MMKMTTTILAMTLGVTLGSTQHAWAKELVHRSAAPAEDAHATYGSCGQMISNKNGAHSVGVPSWVLKKWPELRKDDAIWTLHGRCDNARHIFITCFPGGGDDGSKQGCSDGTYEWEE